MKTTPRPMTEAQRSQRRPRFLDLAACKACMVPTSAPSPVPSVKEAASSTVSDTPSNPLIFLVPNILSILSQTSGVQKVAYSRYVTAFAHKKLTQVVSVIFVPSRKRVRFLQVRRIFKNWGLLKWPRRPGEKDSKEQPPAANPRKRGKDTEKVDAVLGCSYVGCDSLCAPSRSRWKSYFPMFPTVGYRGRESEKKTDFGFSIILTKGDNSPLVFSFGLSIYENDA